MGPQEEGSLNIVTLLMTGRATPYLHNGVVYVGDEDHYALPQFGVLARGIIGLLVYEGENEAAHVIYDYFYLSLKIITFPFSHPPSNRDHVLKLQHFQFG